MKKLLSTLLISLFLVALSCDGGESDDSSLNSKAINLGVNYDESINGETAKYFTFQTINTGNYRITVSNMTTDCDWLLMEYTTNNLNDYLEAASNGDYVHLQWDYDDTTLETADVYLDAATKYLIEVTNWWPQSGSFRLRVSAL